MWTDLIVASLKGENIDDESCYRFCVKANSSNPIQDRGIVIGERELIHDGLSKLKKSIIGTMYEEFEALLHSCHELEGFAW